MSVFVFPGQGSQYVGMAKDFYDNFDTAKLTFEEIEEYVGLKLKKIIFEDNDNSLNLTKNTQISIFTASVAIFKTFQKETDLDTSSVNIMMGHSLGEYSALACSNKLSLKECSTTLKKRGELMNNAIQPNKTGMVALIGINAEQVKKIIKENNLEIEIANDNSQIQVVISGSLEEIQKNEKLFLENGVKKYILLNVSAAFHSKYMKEAQLKLSKEIENLIFDKNNIKILSNYTANLSNDNLIIKNSLQNQMANMVRWTESIKKLEEIGETDIIEIGPNKVLSGLIKRISNSFDIRSISKISDLN